MNRVIRRHPNALIADQRSDIKISARDLSRIINAQGRAAAVR